MSRSNDDSYSACAWCGKAAEDSTLAYTPQGMCCPQCVRTAQAEQMRAADLKPRLSGVDRTTLEGLAARLQEAASVAAPPTDPDYPRQCVVAAGVTEACVTGLDIYEIVGAATHECPDEDELDLRISKVIQDLVWLVRWQTKEVAHTARRLIALEETAKKARSKERQAYQQAHVYREIYQRDRAKGEN